ncbi:MAG: glycogen/starch/alpha-glucan phosphorylase, partial [Clostridium sp.]
MLAKIVRECYGKEISECRKEELYHALLTLVQKKAGEKEENTGKKKLYYISAEFLIGKLLSNNLINLGIYEEVKKELSDAGKSLTDLEEYEPEPSLGNGGLGRLAACFLDSIATLSLPGDGVGLNYHYGLFRQEFKNRKQMEEPNPWMNKDSWLIRSDKSFTVSFGGFDVKASLYDILVTGYESRTNRLHLFDLDSVDETIVHDGIEFDKEDIRKNLTLFLYPDDSDDKGRLLRVYQQYFMVSCGAQLILSEAKDRGCNLHDLADYAAIQINDTHPSMVIPELIRLLMKEGIPFDEAAEIVTNTCAYTNHTILAEALEKWPMSFIEEVAPAIVPIIQKLNEKINAQYHDEKVAIIDGENRVHMA